MRSHENLGSASEASTQLSIAMRLNYLTKIEYLELDSELDEIGRMISGLTRSLAKRGT